MDLKASPAGPLLKLCSKRCSQLLLANLSHVMFLLCYSHIALFGLSLSKGLDLGGNRGKICVSVQEFCNPLQLVMSILAWIEMLDR